MLIDTLVTLSLFTAVCY